MRDLRRASLAALAVMTLVVTAGAAEAHTARNCSSQGLSFSYQQGSASFGNKVEGLTAGGVSCTTARHVATVVAKALLHDGRVPTRIDGLRVRVTNPCTGCAPVSQVRATAAGKSVKFDVYGGA
jgi:hypothetical protein